MTRYYCSYFDRNYLVKALALMESLAKHEVKPYKLFAICLDEISRVLLQKLGFPNIVPVPLHKIEEGDEGLLAAKRNRSLIEYYWTTTPTIVLKLLELYPEIDLLTYVDADLFFFSSPEPIFEEMGVNSILIHEHRFPPSLKHLEANGRFNVGLLCFRKDASGLRALNWWRARCLEWCSATPEGEKMGDQGYLNDWPTRFEKIRVLENIGAGVGPWNHIQYTFSIAENGTVLLDGRPLIFYHYHSLVLIQPGLILPVKHVVYPLSSEILRYCFVPYAEALGRALSKLNEFLPNFGFGRVRGHAISPEHVYLIKRSVLEYSSKLSFPNPVADLELDWAFSSPELIRPVIGHATESKPPSIVSAIVSTHNSEKFIRGCLEDLVDQTLYEKGQLEIIVVDSGSQQNEQAIVGDFQKHYQGITYLRTEQRETIYDAWNRAIRVARGKYITNANTDDRHRKDALERMATELEKSQVGLVYADSLITTRENETFSINSAEVVLQWPEYSLRQLLLYSFFGPHPMWRRSLHEQVGFFDSGYQIAGDYEFFIRLAEQFGALRIPEVLGLYYASGLESRNQQLCRQETQRLLAAHRRRIPIERVYAGLGQAPDRNLATCAALVDFGNCLTSGLYPDIDFAQSCYRRALDLAPESREIQFNLAILMLATDDPRSGNGMLERLINEGFQPAVHISTRIKRVLDQKRALPVIGICHPVVNILPKLLSPEATRQRWSRSSGAKVTGGAQGSLQRDSSADHRFAGTVRHAGFSFCVITKGKGPEKLCQEIESIRAQDIPCYEIVIAGAVPSEATGPDIKVVSLKEAAERGRTSVLRNAAAAKSQYDTIVFCDDDIVFTNGWFQSLQPLLNTYDILATRLLNLDGTRHWDWATIGGSSGQVMLDYGERDDHMYLTSGLVVVNACVWESIQWDERLGYYQGEDVDFSKRVLKAGFKLGLCEKSVAIHNDEAYTQVGRIVVKRTAEGASRWANGEIAKLTPPELVNRAALELRQGRVAEAADCLRCCLIAEPTHPAAQQLWQEIVTGTRGATKESRGVPLRHVFLTRRPILATPFKYSTSDQADSMKFDLSLSSQESTCSSSGVASESRPPFIVSAVVSTYNSEKFIRGCLEDLVHQTLYEKGQLEIIVVDSGSQENERTIVREFQGTSKNIRYIRTEQRETIYAAWNRAIECSRGNYITNANTDDIHRSDALERLLAALERFPQTYLAYGDYLASTSLQESFSEHHPGRLVLHPPYHPASAMFFCATGCHPLWRRTVFDKIGRFDAKFTSPGDYEFLLRFVKAGFVAVHVPEVLSLFYENPKGIQFGGWSKSEEELRSIQARYRQEMPIGRLFNVEPGNIESEVAAWIALGNMAMRHELPWADQPAMDAAYASFCYDRALRLAPQNVPAIANRILAAAVQGDDQTARLLLKRLPPEEALKVQIPSHPEQLKLAPIQIPPATPTLVFVGSVLSVDTVLINSPEHSSLVRTRSALEKAGELEPQNADLMDSLGVIEFRLGDFDKAHQYFTTAATLDPNKTEIFVQLALVNLRLERIEEFETALGRALELDPNHHEALKLLADLNFQNGQWKDAAQTYTKIVSRHPEDVEALLGLGTCFLKTGDLEMARTVFERVLEFDPKNALAKENLEAVSKAPHPSSGHPLPSDGRGRGEGPGQGVEASGQKSEVGGQGAEDQGPRTGDRGPRTTDHGPRTGELLAKAEEEYQAGNLRKACEILRRVAEIEPQNFDVLVSLGSTCFRLDEFLEAQACFSRASQLRGDNPSVFVQLALANLKLDRVEDFEAALGRALELDPYHHDGLKLLADLNFQRGGLKDAAQTYTKLLSRYPEDVESLLALGVCFFKSGDSEMAKTVFERVLEVDPGNILARENIEQVTSDKGRVTSKEGRGESDESQVTSDEKGTPSNHPTIQPSSDSFPTNPPIHPSTNPSSLTNPSPSARADELVDQANFFEEAGNREAALESLEEAAELSPRDAGILAALGSMQFTAGNYEAARMRFRRVIELRPRDPDAYTRLAMTCLKLGRIDEMESALGIALEIDPDNREALKFLGKTNLENNRVRDAGRVYAKLLEKQPEDLESLLTLGLCFYRGGDLDSARMVYERVIEFDPDNLTARENLVQINRQTSPNPSLPVPAPAPKEMAGALTKAQELQHWLSKADEAFGTQNLAAARDALEIALNLAPDTPEILSALGTLCFQLGDIERARTHLCGLVKRVPGDSGHWARLALAHYRLDEITEFEAALGRALSLDPNHLEALRMLAHLNFTHGSIADAAQNYGKVLKQTPDDIETIMALGVCFYKLRDYESAKMMFERVVELDPTHALARENLQTVSRRLPNTSATAGQAGGGVSSEREQQAASAVPRSEGQAASSIPRLDDLLERASTHVSTGDLQRACDVLRQAAGLVPQDADIAATLGSLLYQLGDPQSSEVELARAVRLRPDSADFQTRWAVALLTLERIADFESALGRAIELEANYIPALKLLADLNLRQEKFKDAADTYFRILRQDPDNIEIILSMGVCFYKTGDTSAARAMYERILKLQPDHALAQENLQLLQNLNRNSEDSDTLKGADMTTSALTPSLSHSERERVPEGRVRACANPMGIDLEGEGTENVKPVGSSVEAVSQGVGPKEASSAPLLTVSERPLEKRIEAGAATPERPASAGLPGQGIPVIWEGSQFVHHSLALVNRELCLGLMALGHEISILPYEPDQFGAEADSRFAQLASRIRAPLLNRNKEDGNTLKAAHTMTGALTPSLSHSEWERVHEEQVRVCDNLMCSGLGEAKVHVRHQWPFNPLAPSVGHWVVIQPWEFGSLPAEWVHVLRDQVDEVWVYTHFVRETYLQAGIPSEKVFVVPAGVNPRKFHPSAPPIALATRKKFKFLFVGGTIHRKGPDLLLDAYARRFTSADDVCLVIKDFGGTTVYRGQTLGPRIREIQTNPNAPEILYLNQDLPPDSLPGLYAACDCLVHPYRGEGFGLPVLEAMACGLPVIVTAGGSTDDFATDEFSYRIPASRKNIGDKVGDIKLIAEGWLLEPDLASLTDRIGFVFEHREEAKARGLRASEHVHQNWTWEAAARKANERLEQLAARTDLPLRLRSGSARQRTPVKVVLPSVATLGSLKNVHDLLERKKYFKAWNAALEAISLRPFHPDAYLQMVEIALAAQDDRQAFLCAERLLQLTPNWEMAKKVHAALKPQKKGRRSKIKWIPLPALPERPRLTVCVIAKNEERFIGQCLTSVKPLASQLVVVDTGSTDRTVEIAKEHGAEIYHFTWNDDFSEARNAAHEHARGDWVLILDADEEMAAANHPDLIRDMSAPNVLGYRIPICNLHESPDSVSYVPRLFRNAPALFFVGRVHEQIYASVIARKSEWGMEAKLGTATIIHHGYDPEVIKERKKVKRNLRLIERAVEEMPDEPALLMNYGLDLVNDGRLEEGLEKYRQAVRILEPQPAHGVLPEVRERLMTLFGVHLVRAGHMEELYRVMTSKLAIDSGPTASMSFLAGLALMKLNRSAEAIPYFRAALSQRDRPALTPPCPGAMTGGLHHLLAECLALTRQPEEAEKEFRRALEMEPRAAGAIHDYARFLHSQDRSLEALQILHTAIAQDLNDERIWQLGAFIANSKPEFIEFALDWTGEAMKFYPEHEVISGFRGESLLKAGRLAEALPFFQKEVHATKPAGRAAIILCQLAAAGNSQLVVSPDQELVVSREFVSWYRRLLATKANEAVMAVNRRIEELRVILPTAAAMLKQALSESES